MRESSRTAPDRFCLAHSTVGSGWSRNQLCGADSGLLLNMYIWRVARLARSLYEVPRGLDKRLIDRSADWQADVYAKYEHYLELGDSMDEQEFIWEKFNFNSSQRRLRLFEPVSSCDMPPRYGGTVIA